MSKIETMGVEFKMRCFHLKEKLIWTNFSRLILGEKSNLILRVSFLSVLTLLFALTLTLRAQKWAVVSRLDFFFFPIHR